MEQGRNDENLKHHQDQHHQQPLRQMKPPENHSHQHHQPPPPQKCPRCDSSNTKFCYYNNYSLTQPRYFCKACRRYWTQGGTLRNVPVGGGCRKSKRPKPSSPPSSATEITRTQSLSPTLPLTGSNPGQPLRPLPPVGGNNFYTGSSFLPSFSGATVNLGGGHIHYDANMALLQSLNPSLKPQTPPQQFHVQNEFFQSQQSFRPLTSWTHSFINRNPATTSAASPNFWTGADGDNQAGSSFNPNHWPDNHPGFDPSP